MEHQAHSNKVFRCSLLALHVAAVKEGNLIFNIEPSKGAWQVECYFLQSAPENISPNVLRSLWLSPFVLLQHKLVHILKILHTEIYGRFGEDEIAFMVMS